MIIASSTPFSENERVQDDWAAMVAAHRVQLLTQDQTGAVTVRFSRDHWEAKPFLQSEIFRSNKR